MLQQGIGGGNGGFSTDAMKQQLMTLLMFKSTTSSTNDNGQSSIITMIYSFAVLTLIEQIMRYFPIIVAWIKNKIVAKQFIHTITNITDIDQKSASMSITVYLQRPDMLGLAIMDYITHHDKTRSIFYTGTMFTLNDEKPIEMDKELQIFGLLLKTEITADVNPQHGSGSGGGGGVSAMENTKQVIELYSHNPNITIADLRKFITKTVINYGIKTKNKLGDKIYYFNNISIPAFVGPDGTKDYSRMPKTLGFTMKEFKTNRTFDNVVGSETKRIRNRVEFFIKNEAWYNEKGIPYTLGLLLSGSPGTGKTSTIKAVASATKNRHIVNLNLNNDITSSQMENLFFSDVLQVEQDGKLEQIIIPIDQRIYVFEDVDCDNSDIVIDRDLLELEINRKKEVELLKQKEMAKQGGPKPASDMFDARTGIRTHAGHGLEMVSASKLSLSVFLNLLDGILETRGRILIMTSNHPEKLDKALIRPGRIDLKCVFKRCSNNMLCEFMCKFYGIELSTDEIQSIYSLPEERWSPAEFTKILFENMDNYKQALTIIHTIVKEEKEAREKEAREQEAREKEAREKEEEEDEKENNNLSSSLHLLRPINRDSSRAMPCWAPPHGFKAFQMDGSSRDDDSYDTKSTRLAH